MPEILSPTTSSTPAPNSTPLLQPDGWLARYDQLGLASLSPTARQVVHEDSAHIVDKCLLPASAPNWPASRTRTGIVVGAVQSGKTASMLAVSARLLDRGLDIIIILAGTRIALWRQTYERLLRDLDGTTTETFRTRKRERLLIPYPAALLDAVARPGAPTYMAREGSMFERSLHRKRPVIIVIPKVEDHLLAVSKFLEEHIGAAAVDRPLEMVVLDDEADDGSVLDADSKKIIPRRIEMLWTGRRTAETMVPQLFATYVAYTATPQANFLQADHNPLSPRHFCTALRTPYKTGSLLPRQVTFAEPMGVSRYYCGGEMFYVELAESNAPLVHIRPFPAKGEQSDAEHDAQIRASADELLLDGMRSFLVSAALRLLVARSTGGLAYSDIQDGFDIADVELLPKPHTMLVHPSARLDLHTNEAWRLVLLSRGLDPNDPDTPAFNPAELTLSSAGLKDQINAVPAAWQYWIREYADTRAALELVPGGHALLNPSDITWTAVRTVLLDEVIPYTRIRIINSDPESDDRPLFAPVVAKSGVLLPPPDILTIFVSGNVMSRGLTIEGLHVSVFTRPANEPAADTQMQMQRWFGYRGAHMHMCRLFCFDDQRDLFRTYHEHDSMLRREILAAMDGEAEMSPLMVLTGSNSLATAKVRAKRLPLHPGPSPYIRILETGEHTEHNATLLHNVLQEGFWVDLQPEDKVLGRIRGETLSLEEAATLLEQLRYTHHDPNRNQSVHYTRWASLERQHSIEQPLFRPPGVRPCLPAVDVKQCPYSIAAYLRLWGEALKRPRCDGLYATHTTRQPWAMVQPSLTPPRFFVGVRYGSAPDTSWAKNGMLGGVRALQRAAETDDDGVLRMSGSWGSRGRSGRYLGDQLFDYHHHGRQAPALHRDGPLWRPLGHPGLLLFQVIQVEGHEHDAVTVGLALPHGGPEQFAAVPAGLEP